MTCLIAGAICLGLLYLLFLSCAFGNHTYETIESDADNTFHTMKCTGCGKIRIYSHYDGIGG